MKPAMTLSRLTASAVVTAREREKQVCQETERQLSPADSAHERSFSPDTKRASPLSAVRFERPSCHRHLAPLTSPTSPGLATNDFSQSYLTLRGKSSVSDSIGRLQAPWN